MITKQNYHESIAELDIESLPEEFRDGHKVYLDSEKYPEDEEIQKVVELYLKSLNKFLKKNVKANEETKSKSVTQPKPKTPKNPKVAAPKETIQQRAPLARRKEEVIIPSQKVVVLGEEVKFIKRFVGFHNKDKPLTSLLTYLKSLQRAILLKHIRKTSPFASEIQKIQQWLVNKYNAHGQDGVIKVEINEDDLAKYVGIVGGESVYKSVGFIRRFIGMQGKEVDQKAVDIYLKSINRAKITDEDPYFDKVQAIVNYIIKKKKGKPVKAEEQELNGLQSILDGCGCNHLGRIYDTGMKELRQCHSQKYSDAKKGACSHHKGVKKSKKCKELNGIMTAEEVAGMQYEKLPFEGRWVELIGLPATDFDMMVFGQPGSGKTTFLLLFAHYLATKFGNVLYISGEEYDSSPLTEKVNALPSIPSRLVFGQSLNKLPIPLYNFQFVILDSVTDLGIDIETYKSMREQNPDTAFILILQTTKDGKFKGGKEWEHEVEIAGEIEEGTISIYKNRYGVKGKLNFFENNN